MANGYLTPLRRGSLALGGSSGTGSLFDLHRQMNRLFDDLFERDRPAGSAAGGRAPSVPALDVHADDKHIEITAELPGVSEEDIDLTIEDGVLTLSGEKKSERKDESGYTERSYGRFERSLTLPSDADDEHCSAEFRDGVLRITLPRTEAKSRGRRIPLGGGGQQAQLNAQNDAEPASGQQAAEEPGRSREGDRQQG